MTDKPILTLANNDNEILACHVLERYGIKTVNDLTQFITENSGGWGELIERFRGMGPAKMIAVREMVKRAKLVK